jgi:hypothetical protein
MTDADIFITNAKHIAAVALPRVFFVIFPPEIISAFRIDLSDRNVFTDAAPDCICGVVSGSVRPGMRKFQRNFRRSLHGDPLKAIVKLKGSEIGIVFLFGIAGIPCPAPF